VEIIELRSEHRFLGLKTYQNDLMGEDMIKNGINGAATFMALLIAIAVLTSNSMAGECASCKGPAEDWSKSAQSFLAGKSIEQTISSQTTAQQSRASALNSNGNVPQRSSSLEKMLVPMSSDVSSYDVILDVSPQAAEYIQGAISIPYDNFLGIDGSVKPVSEVAKILGDAGISAQNSILVYGKCLPCGTNVLTSPYVFWILKYLGHDKVKMLDGNIDDWVAAKQPTETVPKVLPKTNYTPNLKADLLATYDYVKNGHVQIVDARTFQDYGMGYIPGALNIPYDQVLSNGRMKNEAELDDLFTSKNLNKTKPVVVYTNMGTQASIVWFALALMGYDARLYSWNDWVAHQPHLEIELQDIRADPNPASPGSPIKITALFGEAKNKAATAKNASSNETGQTLLTTKGCVTCGFGSPQGFANINKSSGIAQLGNSGAPRSQSEAFACTASIKDAAGKDVGKVNMKRVSGDQYAGIWNANVGEGTYQATIVASAGGAAKTFHNVLEIKIVAK
jgi:thiosulfate/3-mercaptopyruvate sulfurtransferase